MKSKEKKTGTEGIWEKTKNLDNLNFIKAKI